MDSARHHPDPLVVRTDWRWSVAGVAFLGIIAIGTAIHAFTTGPASELVVTLVTGVAAAYFAKAVIQRDVLVIQSGGLVVCGSGRRLAWHDIDRIRIREYQSTFHPHTHPA